METANFLNHHPFSRSLPRSRSEDGDEDGDGDDNEVMMVKISDDHHNFQDPRK